MTVHFAVSSVRQETEDGDKESVVGGRSDVFTIVVADVMVRRCLAGE